MKKLFTYRLAALLCAILSLVSCIYDEHADVVDGPGLIFKVRTQSSTKVSYDGGLFSTAFENDDVVGCVIAEKSEDGFTFMSNTKWAFQNGVLMLQDAENAYIKKVEDSAKAAEGYVELAGNLGAYSFFFYYPYVEATPGEDFPKSREEFLVQTPSSENWTGFPLFVNLEQTTKGKLNCSDFLWVGYTLDQKSGINDITIDNANYPVNLEFLKKTATIEVFSDAAISGTTIKTTVPSTGDPLPIMRGCSIDLSTGAMSAYMPATDDSDDSNESLQYRSQKITSEEGFTPFNYGSSRRFRFILPAQEDFSGTLSFTLNEKNYSAVLSNLTTLEEGKLYIIYIASDDGSIIINDWVDGSHGDLEEIIPGKILIYSMTADRFKAGYTVTITGEELDETAYILMEGASITEFAVNGDGTVLTFIIPDSAKDGKIVVVSKTASETEAGEVTLVKPSEVVLSPSTIKPGEILTITGKDLDLVESVNFAGDLNVNITANGSGIKVTVPADALSGNLFLNLKNETSVDGGILTVLQPSVTSMTADKFKAGNVVTITGENLDMVKSVVLPGSGEVALSSRTAETITFILPELAQDGQIVLVNEYDGEIVSDKCILELVKPSEISYAPADLEAGQELTISGADLDLVKSITFADGTTVEVTSTENEIRTTVPTTAVSGDLILNLKNNTQFTAPVLNLVEPKVTSISGKHKDGETLTLTGDYLNKVTKVKISGIEVTFTYDGSSSITFTVPSDTPDGEIILVTAMGAEIKGGDYVTVVPTNLATDPSSVKLGSSFSITGDDLDLVTAISLPGSGDLTASDWSYADGKIMVNALPETATDGDIILTTKYGKDSMVPIQIIDPAAAAYHELFNGSFQGGNWNIINCDWNQWDISSNDITIIIRLSGSGTLILRTLWSNVVATYNINFSNPTELEIEVTSEIYEMLKNQNNNFVLDCSSELIVTNVTLKVITK